MGALLQVLCVVALMGVGAAARRRGLVGAAGTAEAARLLVGVFYPGLVFATLVRLPARDLFSQLHLPAAAGALALCGLALGALALRVLRPADPARRRAFLFVATLNNYVFLPLPLVLLRHGERGAAVLFLATVGWEAVLWTVGLYLFQPGATPAQRLRGLASPAMLALVAALGVAALRDLAGLRVEAGPAAAAARVLLFGLDTLGRATVGLSLIVAGSRLAVLHPRCLRARELWVASALRVLVVPLLAAVALRALPLPPLSRSVLLVVAAMPSAVAGVVFSERYGGDGDFIAASLLVTHLAAAVTVPLFLAFA